MNTPHQTTNDRILLVTLSNIGDLVMTTPVMRVLHEIFPNHLIDIVADRRSGELLEPCPFVGDLIWKDKRQTWVEKLRFLRRIREHHYDLAIDLRGPWLAWLARATRIGLKTKRMENMHAVEHHLTALSGLAEEIEIPNTKLWLSKHALEKADSVLGTDTSKPVLALAPGANWPGKIWPLQAFAELVHLLENDFAEILLLGGPDDYDLAKNIANNSPIPAKNLCGKSTLIETAAGLSRATAFVGNDSGVGHMAAALNIPTMTVFGEGDPVRYRPWGDKAGIVLAPDKNLNALSAEKVIEALKSHLEKLDKH